MDIEFENADIELRIEICLVLVLISSPRQQNGIDKYPEGSKSCASLFSILVVVSCILPNSEDKRVKVLEERVKE
ncbi:hypothetical protein K1719_026066 [Acacia pycnantha]|nr:hypothetical protein K1719_026066 [Acacia pycnantha]